MLNISAQRFKNKNNQMLHGILEKPLESKDKSICILLLSPGIKMRVAPHQLYRKMSKCFVDLGYTVFRFDFYGLGDSEGVVDEKFLADLYGSIQIGRYVDDTLYAINWVSSNHNIDRFILGGLCGGAITGLLAAKNDERVEGLLGLGIPVVLDSSTTDMSTYLTSGHIDRLHQGYMKRLFNIKSWLRLLTFQSDYKVIWKVIKNKLGSKMEREDRDNIKKVINGKESDNSNPLFAPALLDMLSRGKKVNFIFSGSDRLDWEYEEKFVARYHDQVEKYNENLEVSTIPDANHILTMSEWQEDMLSNTARWLDKNFME